MSTGRLISIVILTAVLTCGMVVSGAAAQQDNAPGPERGAFSDVDTEHWAYEPISDMAGRNILNGYPDGTFRPQQPVSRSEFVAMLSAVLDPELKERSETGFADVPAGAWYKPALEAVARYMPGTETRQDQRFFRPQDNATREEVVVALVRALEMDSTFVDPSLLRQYFTDYNAVDPAARIPMARAYQNNLLSGFPDGTLRPQDSISRAEVAALLYRAFFIDSSIQGLIASREIRPLTDSSPEFSALVTRLQGKFGTIETGAQQAYGVEYYARQVTLYDEGPRVIYIFGAIEPRYHSWQADYSGNAGAVGDFARQVAGEAAQLYPRDTILVLLGHRINFLFDVSGIYDDRYLSRTGDGWRLERFYSGVMINNGLVTETWSE